MSERRTQSKRAPQQDARAGEGLKSRLTAVEILDRVAQKNGFADALLGGALPDFAPPDRRLITRLVLGTLAWQGRLDFELEHLTGRPLEGIQPSALTIMRMGLFQLRFLDRIPPHAVVDTAVNIAKRIPNARKASGFINAVMRRATREISPMPPRESDEASFLTVTLSHPRWMVERFVEWFGVADAERLMAANNESAPNAIRLNLARGTRDEIVEELRAEGFEINAQGGMPETVVLSGAANFESQSYRDGLFHAQSEASQLAARMLAPGAEATVIDCAAAPGGKTTHLAEMVGEQGRVVAIDLNFNGLRNARALARRLRHRNVDFVRADMSKAAPLAPSSFDYVMLDAPCTGLGTLREHPEIKWRLRQADFARMATLQLRMLENAAALVRRGGAIVYSVCSIAPDEGELVIDKFLARHSDFAIDDGMVRRDEFRGVIDRRGFMKTRPDLGGLDGFFAARLIRR